MQPEDDTKLVVKWPRSTSYMAVCAGAFFLPCHKFDIVGLKSRFSKNNQYWFLNSTTINIWLSISRMRKNVLQNHAKWNIFSQLCKKIRANCLKTKGTYFWTKWNQRKRPERGFLELERISRKDKYRSRDWRNHQKMEKYWDSEDWQLYFWECLEYFFCENMKKMSLKGLIFLRINKYTWDLAITGMYSMVIQI